MIWQSSHHRTIVQAADAVATFVSFLLAYYLWRLLHSFLPLGAEIRVSSSHILLMIAASLIWVFIFNAQGAYSYQRFTSFATEFKLICRTVFLGSLLLFALAFMLRPEYVPRTLVMLFILVNLGLLSLEKLCLFAIAKVIRNRGWDRKNVLVAGTGNQARQFVGTIQKHFHWGLDIEGFLGADRGKVGQEIFGKNVLGTFSEISKVLQAHPVDEVIIAVSRSHLGQVREVLEACEREGVQVRIVSDFLGEIAKRFRADVVYGLPVISISYIPENQTALAIKRGMDIVISSVALVLLAPLFAVIAAAIKLSSPGPVFYKMDWVGFNKKPFQGWKFRTMVENAETMLAQLAHLNEMKGPVFKIANDPRITPLGRFLRRYSLDELPQLWSVLKGDLSLVGPRPAGPHELARYESRQRRKLSIKPGITCLWQVRGRNKIDNFDDWVNLDLAYIDNWSLALDLKILFKTLIVVLKGTGV